jgi:hypothetical protein
LPANSKILALTVERSTREAWIYGGSDLGNPSNGKKYA